MGRRGAGAVVRRRTVTRRSDRRSAGRGRDGERRYTGRLRRSRERDSARRARRTGGASGEERFCGGGVGRPAEDRAVAVGRGRPRDRSGAARLPLAADGSAIGRGGAPSGDAAVREGGVGRPGLEAARRRHEQEQSARRSLAWKKGGARCTRGPQGRHSFGGDPGWRDAICGGPPPRRLETDALRDGRPKDDVGRGGGCGGSPSRSPRGGGRGRPRRPAMRSIGNLRTSGRWKSQKATQGPYRTHPLKSKPNSPRPPRRRSPPATRDANFVGSKPPRLTLHLQGIHYER